MALPITLASGYVAIYGTGTTQSPSGIANTSADGNIRWGEVYQVWSGGDAYVYGGDIVQFDNRQVTSRLLYNDYTYTVVPARLVTKNNPLS